MHHVYLLMLDDRLHLAPIGKTPQRILDIGTGTGIWAIDMAEQVESTSLPSHEILIGNFLGAIRPQKL